MLGRRVEADAGVLQHRLRAALAAAQQRTHASLEFLDVERFDQIVVSTRVQASDAFRGAVAGGEDQHRQVMLLGAQLLQQVETIKTWQTQIKQQQIEGFRTQRMQGSDAVVQPIEGIAFGRQGHANPLAEGAVIFDKE